METQNFGSRPTQNRTQNSSEFPNGAIVIYGLHGKCSILAIETKTVSGEAIRFYKLEQQKSNLSRSNRNEPAIWVPVAHAIEKGLRAPLNSSDVESVMNILNSREYYFDLKAPWSQALPKIEATIKSEGAIGLAKAVSYLFVLRKKSHVPSSDAMKYSETVNKLLFREIAEATGNQAKTLEELAQKQMRHKLTLDH